MGEKISHYICRKTTEKIVIDGNLNKPVWQKAVKSSRFVDMVTGDPSFFDTRIASLWDNENLYIAYWSEEPNVQASLTERDSLIWLENDVELFIDGEDSYYELEINALNTVYEVFFIYQDALKHNQQGNTASSKRFNSPEFDLYSHDVMCYVVFRI